MIPKIVHYCWFGGNPLNEEAKTYIESWKKYLPGWQIKEWNEDNFDIHVNPYVEEAYQLKKWAFVSDYARLAILEKEGGIYLDTDVELIRPIDDLLARGAFMGIESCTSRRVLVNPGLLMAAEPDNPVIRDIRLTYENDHFFKERGDASNYTIVKRTSKVLQEKYHLTASNMVQVLEDITIYPKEYFCPMNYKTGALTITEKTRSIHWFAASWLGERQKKRHGQCQKMLQIMPGPLAKPAVFVYSKFGACIDILRSSGVKGLARRILHKEMGTRKGKAK